MKIRFCAALLMAVFCITLFAGCAAANTLRLVPLASEAIDSELTTIPRAVAERGEVDRLTKEAVTEIALQHAGLTAAEVTGLRVDFEYDDGIPEYEVDFCHGGYEYDYEIHAETGKILFYDKDRDD